MAALAAANEAEIEAVPGVGPTIAQAVAEFFATHANRKLIARLVAAGVAQTEPNAATSGGPLTGQTYVLTGTLPTLSRQQATELIERAGGRVAGSVSKKTTAVVTGDEAGAKLVKARELGIAIIGEQELLRRIEAIGDRE
jgi:DNA ligase (NAD+)